MAATTDMAPSRASTRSKSSTSTRNAAKRSAGNGSSSRSREAALEEQIERLQGDLQSIAATLTGLAGDKVSEVRSAAQKEAGHLARTGQRAVDEVQDEFGQIEKQLKDTIREKPLTAVAGAIALGFILAVVSR